MHQHIEEYKSVRTFFMQWLDQLNEKLLALDPDYYSTPSQKAINRINNNLLYHPLRPTYKDHFGAGLDQISKQGDFYIEIGIEKCFIGGGYWYPNTKQLKNIRAALDYDGEQFVNIINAEKFKNRFGGLIPSDSLQKPPAGYYKNHPYIDLLKRKSFAVGVHLPNADVLDPNFMEKVIEIYFVMLPFRRYLNKAVLL